MVKNRRNTADLRTAEERRISWRFCFFRHGITVAVRSHTLTCAHRRHQWGWNPLSGGSATASVRTLHALWRLCHAQLRFAAFVGAHMRYEYAHRHSPALRDNRSRSLAVARRSPAIVHDGMKKRRAEQENHQFFGSHGGHTMPPRKKRIVASARVVPVPAPPPKDAMVPDHPDEPDEDAISDGKCYW